MLRVCVILVSVCVLGAGSISGKGLFCRDPDTGMLHPANTSWISSSFCGNYHCKLRRKNITETEYAPFRQMNVTNIKLFGKNFSEESIKNNTVFFNNKELAGVISTDKKTEPDNVDHIQIPNKLSIDINKELPDNNIDDKNKAEMDRYLTDKEIRTISEILQTMRRSDLDAIIEIYNLAQDIYKQIDTTSTDHVLDDVLNKGNIINHYKTKPDFSRNAKKNTHVSYWYEPLSNSKIRTADLMRTDIMRAEINRNDVVPVIQAIPADMENQSSNVVQVAQTTSTKVIPTPIIQVTLPPPPNLRRITATYFNGPLSNQDFGKLPYYFPITNFQRLSSYMHKQQHSKHSNPKGQTAKGQVAKQLLAKPVFQPITYRPHLYGGGKYNKKEIKPSILLPYPFSFIHHYNWSYPQNTYRSYNHLYPFELLSKVKDKNIVKNFVQETGNAVLMNPYLENFHDLAVKPMRNDDKRPTRTMVEKSKEDKQRPDWQTDQLPNQILEEVRAHIQEKQRLLKPFSFKKKVNLERVGKLIKFDETTRNKRALPKNIETSNDGPPETELYEVYIDKTTCNADYSIPGYFRHGNQALPYPDCCPQRITNR